MLPVGGAFSFDIYALVLPETEPESTITNLATVSSRHRRSGGDQQPATSDNYVLAEGRPEDHQVREAGRAGEGRRDPDVHGDRRQPGSELRRSGGGQGHPAVGQASSTCSASRATGRFRCTSVPAGRSGRGHRHRRAACDGLHPRPSRWRSWGLDWRGAGEPGSLDADDAREGAGDAGHQQRGAGHERCVHRPRLEQQLRVRGARDHGRGGPAGDKAGPATVVAGRRCSTRSR